MNILKKYPEFEWLKFLREIIKENQGEINLITIGPLTNIGILFKVCPEIPSLLKSLYIMGGVFFEKEKYAEWNISCDPYAAHIVFSSNVKEIYVCGLDVTKRVWMGKKEVYERFEKNELLKEILNFAEIWFRNREVIIFHDPLAASVLFNKETCEFKKGIVKIEINDKEKMGITEFVEDKNGNVNVATEVNPEKFFDYFFSFFR